MNYFAHHTEFEESGITAKDINQFIKEEILYYDHKLDQSNQSKWNARISLERTNINKLPDYIQKNYDKFKFWIKN